MERNKIIWKYEKIALLLFVLFNIVCLFINGQIVTETLTVNVNKIKIVEFVVNHSKFESKILVDFILKTLFLKDLILATITLILVLFFFPIHRRIVRDGIGVVKIIFIVIFFICFYFLFYVDYALMNYFGLLSPGLIMKYIFHFIILSVMFGLFTWFVIEYVRYRIRNNIAFVTHASIRNLANKMIRHSITLILVMLIIIGSCTLFLSRALQEIISQLEIEKLLGSQLNIDVTKMFSVLPDLIEKIINIKYHPERIGVITLDVEAFGNKIQTLLMSYVQNYTKDILSLVVKTGIFYILFEFLNELYQYRKFKIHVAVYMLLFSLSTRMIFFASNTGIIHIIDCILLVALFLYIATLVKWENILLILICFQYSIKHYIYIKRFNMKKFINIIIGVLITFFGFFLLFNGSAVQFFALYIGILFLLVTIIGFILMRKFNYVEIPYGQFLLTGVFGLVFIFLPTVTYTIIVTLFTVVCFLFSVFYIVKTFQNNDKKMGHLFQIALAIIFIVYSITMLLKPELGGRTLSTIIAIFMIMNGLSYFFINTEFSGE